MQWKAAVFVSSSLLLLLILLLLGWTRLTGTRWDLRPFDSSSLLIQVKNLRQLVTVRYRIERAVGITEPKEPFGSESILLLVEGETQAGVDLSTLTPQDIRWDGPRQAVITLPAPRLFDAFLDEKHTKVWDRQMTWWTPWLAPDPDLEHKARLKALDEIRSASLEMGILDHAQTNAETAIRDLLAAFQIQARFAKQSS